MVDIDAATHADRFDRAVVREQPREMQGSGLWSEIGYGCRLFGRYFRHDPLVGFLLVALTLGANVAAGAYGYRAMVAFAKITDALVARDAAAVWTGVTTVLALKGVLLVSSVVIIAGGNVLQIRWRTVMTKKLLDGWMADRRYHALSWNTALENPEQRIQEDVSLVASYGLNLVTFFVGMVAEVVPYIGHLWTTTGNLSLRPIGVPIDLPGQAIWIGLVWGVAWTWIINWLGRPFQRVEIVRQHLEADFRLGMARVRQSSEAIAFERGDEVERTRLFDRFRLIQLNWRDYNFFGSRLGFFQSVEASTAALFPTLLMAPRILSGQMSIGELAVIAGGFAAIIRGTAWFASSYKTLAQWLASTQRLRLLERLTDEPVPVGAKRAVARQPAILVDDLRIAYPNGTPLLLASDLRIEPGERLLVQGRSGSGKSTFFRALAGLWPFASGLVTMPEGKRVMYLPQRSYMPEGRLLAALTYPANPVDCDVEKVRAFMADLGLSKFTTQLDEVADWSRQLSLGEQQRVAAIRVLLACPDMLFLDEATSALDAELEATLYRALRRCLPETAIVSIAHRASLAEFHEGRLQVVDGVLRRATP